MTLIHVAAARDHCGLTDWASDRRGCGAGDGAGEGGGGVTVTATVTVADVVRVLEAAYPLRLAEEWDTGIGLSCGDPAAGVRRVLLAVDAVPAVVREAGDIGAQLIVTHHPLLFRPVQSVAADTDKGGLLHTLIRSGIAHVAAHTNADRAVDGVNDALADTLGLVDTVPMVPAAAALDPREGLGRVGTLAEPMSLHAFAAQVADRLPPTAWGVRAAGDGNRVVRRVAVCGGSGGGELAAAVAAGADVYVTSDITHHTAAEHVADPARPALVDIAHWAGEWPWLARAAAVIDGAFGGAVESTVSSLGTDPWSLRVGGESRA
jgi:dinuclear metal center YbgI/SA1388 family protein